MTTLFDIGDEIQLTLKGKIKEYSISDRIGDCYTIELNDANTDNKNDKIRVYLDSDQLKLTNAKKVFTD